jgi:hypothetical protein
VPKSGIRSIVAGAVEECGIEPARPDQPAQFATGYADMAIQSWAVFERLQKAGVIPAKVKFQICIPTPIAAPVTKRSGKSLIVVRRYAAHVRDNCPAMVREDLTADHLIRTTAAILLTHEGS